MPAPDRLLVQYTDGLVRLIESTRRRVIAEYASDPRAMAWAGDGEHFIIAQSRRYSSVEFGDGTLLAIHATDGSIAASIATNDDSLPLASDRQCTQFVASSDASGRTRVWPDRPSRPAKRLRMYFTPSLAASERIERIERHEILLKLLERSPSPRAWHAVNSMRETTPELQTNVEAILRITRSCLPWATPQGVRRYFRAWVFADSEATAVVFANSCRWIVSAHADRLLRVWSPSGALLAALDLPHTVGTLVFSESDDTLFAASNIPYKEKQPTHLFAIDSATWSVRWKRPLVVRSLAVHGALVAVATNDCIMVLDHSGRVLRRSSSSAVDVVGWCPGDGRLTTSSDLVVAHDDRTLGSTEIIGSHIVWSPDSRRVAAGDRLWTLTPDSPGRESSVPLASLWSTDHGAIEADALVAGGRLLVGSAVSLGSGLAAWIDLWSGSVLATISISRRNIAVGLDGALAASTTHTGFEVWAIEYEWAFAEDIMRSLAAPHGFPVTLDIVTALNRMVRRPGFSVDNLEHAELGSRCCELERKA